MSVIPVQDRGLFTGLFLLQVGYVRNIWVVKLETDLKGILVSPCSPLCAHSQHSVSLWFALCSLGTIGLLCPHCPPL